MSINYRDLDVPAHTLYWDRARTLLSGDEDALAEPLAYSLWCDFFEDWRQVEDVWHILVQADPPPRLLRRVLDASGPLPFRLKEPLYERLLGDPTWHEAIYRSLLFSCFNAYGDIDKKKAVALLEQLKLPEDIEWLQELRAALSFQG